MKNNNQYILSKECVIIMHTESLLDFLDYILKNVNPEEPDIDNYKVTEIDFKLNSITNVPLPIFMSVIQLALGEL